MVALYLTYTVLQLIIIIPGEPESGMLVVKAGGPAYRIGLGGGAASSVVGGQNTAELDFSAVQVQHNHAIILQLFPNGICNRNNRVTAVRSVMVIELCPTSHRLRLLVPNFSGKGDFLNTSLK